MPNTQIHINKPYFDDIILDYNIIEDFTYHLSPQISTIFGISQTIEHSPEFLIRCGIIQPESIRDFLDLFHRIKEGEPYSECIVHARTAKDELLWVHLSLTTCYEKSGNPVHAIGILKDITQQYEQELLDASERKHQLVLEKGALLYYTVNLSRKKVISNLENVRKSLRVNCSDDYEEILDLLISKLVFPKERSFVREEVSPEALWKHFASNENKIELDYRRFMGDGTINWVRSTVYLYTDTNSNEVYFRVYVNDINHEKFNELNLLERSELDPLTGLFNRMTTEFKIRRSLEDHEPYQQINAIYLINLDHFHIINEELGYLYGDALLSKIGNQLKLLLEPDDIAGRVDGDEFLLYARNLPDQKTAIENGKRLCQRFTADLPEELEKYHFSATVGAAFYPEHGFTFESLAYRADYALQEGKRRGGNQCVTYQKDIIDKEYNSFRHTDLNDTETRRFSANMIEFILRILYDSDDVDRAICSVLELTAEYLGFNHSFLYEITPEGATCSHEWKLPGVIGIPEHHKILSSNTLALCMELFDKDGLYLNKEIPLTREERHIFAFQTKCCLLCSFASNGLTHGFIGFERYGEIQRDFTENDRNLLLSIVQMLDLFQSDRTYSQEIWESTFLLQAVADGLHSCTYIIDPQTYTIRFVNENTLHVAPDAKTGTYCYKTIRGRNEPCEDCPFAIMLANNTSSYQTEMFLDRYHLWARISSTLTKTPTGKAYGIFNGYDFSDQKHGSSQPTDISNFTKDSSLYDALALSTDDYIYLCDVPKNIYYFPPGLVEEFALPGQVIEDAIPVWTERIHEDDRAEFIESCNTIIQGIRDDFHQECRVLNKNNLWIWLSFRGHMERNKDGRPATFAGVVTKLGRKSKIDSLTGLPDKYEFEMQTRAKISEHPSKGALMILGLDNFKYINNIYGWEFGDSVLQEAVQRILTELPEKIHLYRLDGDKFGLHIPNYGQKEAIDFYEAIALTFRHQRQFGAHRYFCTISCGCTIFEGSSPSFEDLFKQATFAFDYAKREGKNRIEFYSEETMNSNERILTLIALLHDSVDNDCFGFEVYYQPQFNPTTNTVKSAEALLRWHCKELGMISPGEFIPLLEQSGLIHKVGNFVLLEAAKTCRKWQLTLPEFTISVNISFLQLQDQTFLPWLKKMTQTNEIDARSLHLELTESCIAHGSKTLNAAFRSLRDMGFQIEMDDFGTGYSSLEILKNAPSDVVKIDQAFVRDIEHSSYDATFIEFVTTLCHSVGIRVCLEGVETWQEYHLVKPMELDIIQGFLFGRPQPEKDFEQNYIYNKPEFAQPEF